MAEQQNSTVARDRQRERAIAQALASYRCARRPHEFVDSDEAREGIAAFEQKRKPDFAPYRARASRIL